MSQLVLCPSCRNQLQVAPQYFGQPVACPFCRNQLVVGHPQSAATAAQLPLQVDRAMPAQSAVKSSKPSFLERIVGGVTTALQQNREQRLQEQSKSLFHELLRQKEHLDLDATSAVLGISSGDLQEVCERVYQRFLEQHWQDGILASQEQRALRFVAEKLRLPSSRTNQLNWTVAQKIFGRMLSSAVSDGHVDEREGDALRVFAQSLGTTVPALMQGYFRGQGEDILRALFAGAVADGQVSEVEWNRLTQTVARLGFSQQQFLESVEPYSRAFVEHVLADAKSDGVLESHEDESLVWLMQRLILPQEFRGYVAAELDELRQITNASRGRLPTIVGKLPIEMRAGEIPHFFAEAIYTTMKQFKAGPRNQQSQGRLLVTDYRLVFSSADRSFELNHRNVVQIDEQYGGIEVRTSTNKGGGIYSFGSRNQLAFAILRTAVGRANQTITDPSGESPSRHIPRDVRQRVWQLYGGRCADCGADQYLEFDHIIPVAKGGSNHDSNIQLLCRRCNSKKSDRI